MQIMKKEELLLNEVYVAICNKTKDYSSIFRHDGKGKLKNRLYLHREIFEKQNESTFTDDGIKNYGWIFLLPTNQQLLWFLQCEKEGEYIPIEQIIINNQIHELW